MMLLVWLSHGTPNHCKQFLSTALTRLIFRGQPSRNVVNILLLFDLTAAKSQWKLMLGYFWGFIKLFWGGNQW